MDHKRRERVVTRLAQEASERRVIVFTHDLYFLNLLIEEAEKNGVPVEEQSLTRRQEGFGAPDPGLPFGEMSTTKRVGYLHNKHQHIKKVYESGDELEHLKLTVSAYQKLRNAQEHAIEEVVVTDLPVDPDYFMRSPILQNLSYCPANPLVYCSIF